jgi:DUF2075 family protein
MALALREPYGWSGSAGAFLTSTTDDLFSRLSAHYMALHGENANHSQVVAWLESIDVLRAAIADLDSDFTLDIIFEYELPFEGGRRPDVVLLSGNSVLVLEFKGAPRIEQAHLDQVAAYRRDLIEYHSGCRGREVHALIVTTARRERNDLEQGVHIVGAEPLAGLIRGLRSPGTDALNLDTWLAAEYAPLPTLVGAARRIFQHERLPHVRRAIAARIPETVELISGLANEAQVRGTRKIVFLTGVPGAGKTLVGLRVVYEHGRDEAAATFLSGNGPLVKVLQDALRSQIFVRDLHKFITSYGLSTRIPGQRLIVFDEAQRAWDAKYMFEKRGIRSSEPELLVGIGSRLPEWATLVGLVGSGQEIYAGEEGGLEQWRRALDTSSVEWEVHCPPSLASSFDPLPVTTHDDLSLDISLRSRRAEQVHQWVQHLLAADISSASTLAQEMRTDDFVMYLAPDLETARRYAQERYRDEQDARYGLLASSQARNLERHGIQNGWIATSRMNIARWFNAPADDPDSSCSLRQPVTEFGCQGLELDLPIVCWGNDLTWQGRTWAPQPARRRYPLDDPVQLLMNSYRVLLTRGRDGLIVDVPDGSETRATLIEAGLLPLS